MTAAIQRGVRPRSCWDSEKSYDALPDDIGDKLVPINTVATDTGNWQEYQERVEPQVGPSGFMLFSLINHGAWITKAGIDRKLMRVILGNPLIAITMLHHDVTAGQSRHGLSGPRLPFGTLGDDDAARNGGNLLEDGDGHAQHR
ncbi:hypothetical protein [Mycobacterium parmense]|uniref:Uncharacterized protein n=1 Tax=Mycobacterium parmense TaxID=185642 RepID=A0A7I7YXQ6_9MYCO|nr:hypothetical protein [Mycobacterium parmense]BBZ45521.1 hypothetical protein MPRM_28020 [Mycobacterium parmense]